MLTEAPVLPAVAVVSLDVNKLVLPVSLSVSVTFWYSLSSTSCRAKLC